MFCKTLRMSADLALHNYSCTTDKLLKHFIRKIIWKNTSNSDGYFWYFYWTRCNIKIPYDKNSLVEYGGSFVAKFSRWLLYAKKMNFRCLGDDFFVFNKRFLCSINDFYMFNKWFSLSANDSSMFNKCFLYSANDFYIQQEIYTFINLKLVFSNMRFIFNNLRFAF